MFFSEMIEHLGEVHPHWSRRVCVLAARLYLGIDTPQQYWQGIMVSAKDTPLLSQGEFHEILQAW